MKRRFVAMLWSAGLILSIAIGSLWAGIAPAAAATPGTALGWGSSTFGQIGIGTTPVKTGSPTTVAGRLTYRGGVILESQDKRFGGLSGLALDVETRLWVGAVDDPIRPRLAWFDVPIRAAGPEVVPRRFTYLRASPGVLTAEELAALDIESLTALPDGGFATTNEGYVDRRGVAHQPAVLRVSRDGVVTALARPRAAFTMRPPDTSRGVRHNLGLEGLAVLPDGRLIAGLEQPLAQDGPVSSASRGGRVRLVEFVPAGSSWAAAREWAYDLDPTPGRIGYGAACQDGETGLSDLHALDAGRLIAIERACLRGAVGAPAFNPVRLYLVELDGADDVSSLASLAGADVRTLRKRLLLDLTTLLPRVPPNLRTLSNFEGVAPGPPAPDGASTLLLVSDDNFRDTQTLAVMWLKINQ